MDIAIKILGGYTIFLMIMEIVGVLMILLKKYENFFVKVILRDREYNGEVGIFILKIAITLLLFLVALNFYLKANLLGALVVLIIVQIMSMGFEKIFNEIRNK